MNTKKVGEKRSGVWRGEEMYLNNRGAREKERGGEGEACRCDCQHSP